MIEANPVSVDSIDQVQASDLPWYRRSKFQAWLMVLFILFGTLAGIPLLLIFWTGKVERPHLTKRGWKNPYYSRGKKAYFSILIIGFMVFHLVSTGF
jgi:hypothetical protein